MTKSKIVDSLKETNPWWKGDFVLDYKPRHIYKEIKKFLETKQILAFTGLRRTGKTTLLFKIAEDKISSGFSVENIVYFSFDDFKTIRIQDVIESYETLMGKTVKNEKYLFLFDEIQKIDGWEEQIKRIYDFNKQLKIVISGSESLFIRKETRESLAGRIFEFKIFPLNFQEYLDFKDLKFENYLLYEKELKKEFLQFIRCNGFPEIIDADISIISKYLKENLIEKIIYRDIPQLFAIKDPTILESIFKLILFEPGQIIILEKLANDLQISRQTVALYLDYLEKSFLIKKLYNFSRNTRKVEHRSKKYYPTIIYPELFEKDLGKAFETVMVNQINTNFFWRDKYKHEIDIVLSDKTIPIEIKSGKNYDLTNMKFFIKKFKSTEAYIVSYEIEEKITLGDVTLQVIPGFKFLLAKNDIIGKTNN